MHGAWWPAMFQSTPPRGRRPSNGSTNRATGMFQSTPPRGRRPVLSVAIAHPRKFQSTPPRGRRRGPGGIIQNIVLVSIHASAREATPLRGKLAQHLFVFQSTPPRGRRLLMGNHSVDDFKFQSTPPRGRRPGPRQRQIHRHQVSIHASAREATVQYASGNTINMFQSTPPRGRRHGEIIQLGTDYWFQSTPPRGRRRDRRRNSRCQDGFNPRLRAGGDPNRIYERRCHRVSIHASAREATLGTTITRQRSSCFNPRLRAGGDNRARESLRAIRSFNPRLRAGGDMSSVPTAPSG